MYNQAALSVLWVLCWDWAIHEMLKKKHISVMNYVFIPSSRTMKASRPILFKCLQGDIIWSFFSIYASEEQSQFNKIVKLVEEDQQNLH